MSLAKHGYLGPSDEGDEVREVQRIIGATITGRYDVETQERVRGLQMVYHQPARDGLWDQELADAIARSRRH